MAEVRLAFCSGAEELKDGKWFLMRTATGGFHVWVRSFRDARAGTLSDLQYLAGVATEEVLLY